MILTVDIKKDYALSVLEGLQKIGAIDIKEPFSEMIAKKTKSYEAVKISLKGYRFNREEANEKCFLDTNINLFTKWISN